MINSLSSLLTTAELCAPNAPSWLLLYIHLYALISLFPFFKENNGAKSPLMSFLCQISKEGKFLPRSHYRHTHTQTHTRRHTSAQITPFCRSKNAFVSTYAWSRLDLSVVSVFCTPLPSLLSCVIFGDPLVEPVQEDSRSSQAPDSFQRPLKP